MRIRRILHSFVSTLLIACALPLPVWGGEFAWPSSPYPYNVVDQDLKIVLKELGRNVGLRMQIDDKITGRVKGRIQHSTAKEFFIQLCSSYGLEWYYDGFTMHISLPEENQTRIIDISGLTLNEFNSKLRSSGISDARFPVVAQQGSHHIALSGPPSYIALVDQLVASLTLSDARTVLYRGESVSVVKFGAAKEEREHN